MPWVRLMTSLFVWSLTVAIASANPAEWQSEGWDTDFSKSSIAWTEIMSGGPPKDGIPSIDEPVFRPVAETVDLAPNDPVIGLQISGDARAYPLRVLIWHEIVNDTVGGLPVTVTYCPLCNSAVVFDRRLSGRILDFGTTGKLRVAAEIPEFDGKEFPATFGQSADAAGNVYVQWHRRDNAGRVEMLKLNGNKVETDFVKGTQTAIQLPGLLSFAAVSVRGKDVYRTRPEQGLGLCCHRPDNDQPDILCSAPSICAPVITRRHAIYGGLDGKLYVVSLDGSQTQSLATGFGSPITASVAVADGRIFVSCEDGYLYVFGKEGAASPPTRDLQINRIRSPLGGRMAGEKFDWYTNYGNFGSTNANDQGLRPRHRSAVVRGCGVHRADCRSGRRT